MNQNFNAKRSNKNINVLVVSGRLPTEQNPGTMTFVKSQSESLKNFGINIKYLEIVGSKRLKYLKAIPQIRRICKTEKIDIIHAHHGFSGLAARFQVKVPVIVSYMGDELLLDVDEKGRPLLTSRISFLVFKLLGKLVKAVIVKSEEMASKLGGKNVFVIPNGVDFEKFKPIDKNEARKILGLDNLKRYILFLADPDRTVKDFNTANEAVSKLNKRFDEPVEILKLKDIPPNTVPLLMNAADIVLLTSFSEGSPNVIKESMACGRPIVATDVGDIRNVIGKTKGCHVVPRDPSVISECLEKELQMPIERTTGREDIKHLEINQIAERILSVYKLVLNNHPSK